MKTSVVSKEYLDLQKTLQRLQEKWKMSLKPEAIIGKVDKTAPQAGVPAIALTSFHFDIPLYLQWLNELSAVLCKYNDGLTSSLDKLNSIMNEETAQQWIDEAMAFNDVYFIRFAEENGLDLWIPQFVAETALRPYLQLLAEAVQDQIDFAKPGMGCPVCGEPPRLATLEEEGKKVLHCPRCLAHWHATRLTCSHCGNENHETVKFITIEEDPASQIQVCEECKGYTKIIDTRQYIEQPKASLLDLTSIHLDFVAQEHGYLAVGEKDHKN